MHIPPETFERIARLPGEELIVPGLHDLQAGRFSSLEASLILIARSRLVQAGLTFLDDPEVKEYVQKPQRGDTESHLYRLLCADNPESAHGRYNSLKRRLDSFIRSLELSGLAA